MSATRDNVFKSAMELSETERLLLATELMDTVSDDLPGWSIDDPAFHAELERRAIDGAQTISWEVVQTELHADLNP